MESYKHLFAKQTLARWLADPKQDLVDFKNASGGGPYGGGVFAEYPFCLDSDGCLQGQYPWHELGVWQGRGNRDWFKKDVPTYQECLNVGLLPICIFDVAIHHKGWITHAFEIVHKHGVTDEKHAYIDRIAQEGYLRSIRGLSADWVLSQVGLPRSLKTLWHTTWGY